MKAKIKLFTSEKKTVNGYPIYIEITHLKQRKRKKIGNSFARNWNFENNTPLTTHPDYNALYVAVLEYHAKISKIHIEQYTFEAAVNYLFDVKPKHATFVDACDGLCDRSTTGKLYKTVLNSFDAVYPGIAINAITPAVAMQYMITISRNRSNNGVHAYMRTLNALFNKVSDLQNPFKGIRPQKTPTKSKALTDADVRKLINTRTITHKYDGKNTVDSINYPRYYWMLMFYLGGIDFVDLAKLRYDKHVIDGRINFTRQKGGTNVAVSNKIFDCAQQLLDKFNCYPYLIPAYQFANHNQYLRWTNTRLSATTSDLQLTQKPLTKSARYTFITRAQQLLIDERVTIEIVGHAQQKTHSIYTSEFPKNARDLAHHKIITF